MHMYSVKSWVWLCIHAVLPEPPLFAYRKDRERFRWRMTALAWRSGCAHTFESSQSAATLNPVALRMTKTFLCDATQICSLKFILQVRYYLFVHFFSYFFVVVDIFPIVPAYREQVCVCNTKKFSFQYCYGMHYCVYNHSIMWVKTFIL